MNDAGLSVTLFLRWDRTHPVAILSNEANP